MKPIIVFEFDELSYDPDKAAKFDKYLSEMPLKEDYDMLVLWGGHAKVFYPCKSLMYYYHKIKIWLIRKTVKKNTF